jgi:ATP-binding cassette subfamily B protein
MRHPQMEINTTRNKVKLSLIPKLIPRLAKFLYPVLPTLCLGFLALLVGTAINLSIPFLLQKLFNHEFAITIEENTALLVVFAVAIFFLQSATFYLRHYTFAKAGYRVSTGIRTELFKNIINKEVSFFDTHHIGDLISRLSSDAQALQQALTVNLSVSIRYFFQVIGGSIMMCYISWKLFLILLLILPIIMIAGRFWGKKLGRSSQVIQEHLGIASTIAEESFSGTRTVKLFSNEEGEICRYNNALICAESAGFKRAQIAAIFSSSMVFLVHTAITFVLLYGLTLVTTDQMKSGDLLAFLLYSLLVAASRILTWCL